MCATSSVHFEDQLSLSQQLFPSSLQTKASWHPVFAVATATVAATTDNIRQFYVLESRMNIRTKTQTKNLRVRIIFAILCVRHVPTLSECNCISLQGLGCVGARPCICASRSFIVSVVVVVGIATINISPSEFYVLHGTVSDETFLM